MNEKLRNIKKKKITKRDKFRTNDRNFKKKIQRKIYIKVAIFFLIREIFDKCGEISR